jgi:hypothetical protein
LGKIAFAKDRNFTLSISLRSFLADFKYYKDTNIIKDKELTYFIGFLPIFLCELLAFYFK